MRAVVQRVKACVVTVSGRRTGHIDAGLLVYLGVGKEDTSRDVKPLCDKIVNLRIFTDDQDKMNLSVLDTGGASLSSPSSRCSGTRGKAGVRRTPRRRTHRRRGACTRRSSILSAGPASPSKAASFRP